MATKKSSKARKSGGKKGGAKKGAAKAGKGAAKATASSSNILSPQLNGLIGRALTDKEFRKELFNNRARATRGYSLSKADKDALSQITAADLEQHAASFSSKSALRIVIKVTVKF
jgi:hypothetical protein